MKNPAKLLEQENFDLLYSFIKHYNGLDAAEWTDLVDILGKCMEDLYKKSQV